MKDKNKNTPYENITYERITKDEVICYGYYFHSDGSVLDANRTPVKTHKCNNGRIYINLHINGRVEHIYLARMIYILFTPDFDPCQITNYFIRYRDGNFGNCMYCNLYLEEKAPINHIKVKILTETQVKEIREIYSFPKGKVNQHNKKMISIRDLSKMYGCSAYVIQKVIHNQY